MTILFVILVLCKSASAAYLQRLTTTIVAEVTETVRKDLAANLLAVRWSWLMKRSKDGLSSAVHQNSAIVGQTLLDASQFFITALHIVIHLALILLVSWQTAVASCILSGILILSSLRLSELRANSAQVYDAANLQLSKRLVDILTHARLIKGMGLASSRATQYCESAEKLTPLLKRKTFISQYSSDLLESLAIILLVVWLYTAIAFLHLHLAAVVVSAILLIRISSQLISAVRLYNKLIESTPRLDDILNLLADTKELPESYRGARDAELKNSIRLVNLSFGYNTDLVVNSFSMTCCVGQVTTLRGPSGAGKSTLVDLILGLQVPHSGQIFIDELSLYDELSMESWRHFVGLVPQDHLLAQDTIYANLTLWDSTISTDECWNALRIADADSFVSQLPQGLMTELGARGAGISGGQKQRLMIARALLRRPKILVLDEATTGLDPVAEARVCRNIREYAREADMIVLAISHQDAWVGVSDQVVDI